RNGDVDRLIELHFDEVDVLEVSLHRMEREVADHRDQLLPVEREFEDRVLPELAAQNRGDLLGWHRDRRRGQALAVRNGGNEPTLAQAASLALAGGDAGLGLKDGHAGCGHWKTPITCPPVPPVFGSAGIGGYDGAAACSRPSQPAQRPRRSRPRAPPPRDNVGP